MKAVPNYRVRDHAMWERVRRRTFRRLVKDGQSTLSGPGSISDHRDHFATPAMEAIYPALRGRS